MAEHLGIKLSDSDINIKNEATKDLQNQSSFYKNDITGVASINRFHMPTSTLINLGKLCRSSTKWK